ncbi:MAG: hypothetical protein O2807_04815 [bacterium]|nr:hypothetical protein [bacterium]
MAGGFEPLRVERDIAEEMASTLGRLGERFERSCRKVWELKEGFDQSVAAAERLGGELNAALDEAERLRYYLIVQREAMGMRDHREVAKTYPLPQLPGRPPAPGDPASPRLAWPGVFSRGRRRKSSG